jgi:hypothetical protein
MAETERIDKLRQQFYDMQDAMERAIHEAFPVGHRCAIVRKRKGEPYYIYGEIAGAPTITRLRVRTDSRGTILKADYQDIELIGGK